MEKSFAMEKSQNIGAEINLSEFGLIGSPYHNFIISETLSTTSPETFSNIRTQNVRVYFQSQGTMLIVDSNFGSTVKMLRYLITITCEITNYNTIRALSTNFINVFRRTA